MMSLSLSRRMSEGQQFCTFDFTFVSFFCQNGYIEAVEIVVVGFFVIVLYLESVFWCFCYLEIT